MSTTQHPQQETDEDDFLFTHVPSASLDFVDILNLAESSGQQGKIGRATLPADFNGNGSGNMNRSMEEFEVPDVYGFGNDPEESPDNDNDNDNSTSNPNLNLDLDLNSSSSAPSLSWSHSQSASSPESVLSGPSYPVDDLQGYQPQHQHQHPSQLQSQAQRQVFGGQVDPLSHVGYDGFGMDGFGFGFGFGFDQGFHPDQSFQSNGHHIHSGMPMNVEMQMQMQMDPRYPNSKPNSGLYTNAPRVQGSFEGTLGFGLGGPGMDSEYDHTNFDPAFSASDFDLASSGDVLSEQELKRLLSMGEGAGFGAGGGGGMGTVDWVGLMNGGAVQGQMQGQGQGGSGGMDLSVKRESIDESGSTTSTAKGTASVVEAGDLAPATTTTNGNTMQPPAPASNPNRSPRQQQSKQPGINLHNKVEKRYRSNVKNALDSLRDAVPRLRQVYGTSLPSELETTDKQGEDGLMGGIGEIGKPTKQTIMLGARMYIEYLEMKGMAGEAKREQSDRVLMRLLGTGEDAGGKWARWEQEQERVAREAEEAYRQHLERKNVERALMLAPPGGSTSGGSPSSSSPPDGADEEEEDEAPPVRGRPKKRPRKGDDETEEKKPVKKRPVAKLPKKTGGKKSNAVETVTGAGAAVMYSFGLAYTFFPRASSIFGNSHVAEERQGSSSTGSVILSAPYRAANRSTHLLKRTLPERHHDFWALKPDDFLDWIGLVFLAGVISWITWRLAVSFGWISTGTSSEAEDEVVRDDNEVDVDVLTESGYRARIGTVVEGFKTLGSKFGRRSSDDPATVEKAWLHVTKAFVGKSLNLDAWTQTRVRWRMARKATEDPQYAVLQALHTQDPLQWQHARRLALDTKDKAIQDILALPCSETRALSKRLGPSADPVRSIAEYLVITHLDDLATRLYISLVDASISADTGNKNKLTSLADVSYREQIFEALHGVSRDSPAYSLGLVLIGLWGMLSGQDAAAQRSVANMLIASQLKDRVDLPSIDILLGLVIPAYRPYKPDTAGDSKSSRLPLGVEELDTLLEVCLRYVSLVKRLNSRDPAARRGVYPETLRIRQLLGRPTFERTFKDISGYRLRTGTSMSSDVSSSDTESIASSEDWSISAIEAEVEAFDAQTERLIDSLVDIGQRAVRFL